MRREFWLFHSGRIGACGGAGRPSPMPRPEEPLTHGCGQRRRVTPLSAPKPRLSPGESHGHRSVSASTQCESASQSNLLQVRESSWAEAVFIRRPRGNGATKEDQAVRSPERNHAPDWAAASRIIKAVPCDIAAPQTTPCPRARSSRPPRWRPRNRRSCPCSGAATVRRATVRPVA